MDNCQSDLSQSHVAQSTLTNILRSLLSPDEEEQINQRFDKVCRRDSQVLWSGISRDVAQTWADKRNLQTLTTAMGPLMDADHPSCLKLKKSSRKWSIYIKGASALFACHITRSSKVTLLLPPPPEKFNPNGHTNYQFIEEPILKGMVGDRSVECIQTVHPTVDGAEDFSYQSWPVDRTDEWIEKFPLQITAQVSWRRVKILPEMQRIMAVVTVAEKGICSAQSVAGLPSQVSVFAEGVTSYKSNEDGSRDRNNRSSHVN
jgi:hypothetical protein